MRVVLLGAPGSGKGTQANALALQLRVAHIATGDLFRDHLARGSDLGREAQGYMDRGELVPDVLAIRMLRERIGRSDAAGGYILDGFPRTVEQAAALDDELGARGETIDTVVVLEVPEDELVQRLAGRWTCRGCQATYHETAAPPKKAGRCDRCGGELYQREDEAPATVRRRLAVYQEQTLPVVDYYRRGRLASQDIGWTCIAESDYHRTGAKVVSVAGAGPIEDVRAGLLAALGQGAAVQG